MNSPWPSWPRSVGARRFWAPSVREDGQLRDGSFESLQVKAAPGLGLGLRRRAEDLSVHQDVRRSVGSSGLSDEDEADVVLLAGFDRARRQLEASADVGSRVDSAVVPGM